MGGNARNDVVGDARILCCWRGNVLTALVWCLCLRALYNIGWLAFSLAIDLIWMIFVAVVPIFLFVVALIGLKFKKKGVYVGLLIGLIILLVLDFGYLIYLIVTLCASSGALHTYILKAVIKQHWKHGATTTILILFAIAQFISVLTDLYFIYLLRRILTYLKSVFGANESQDEEHGISHLASPPHPGNSLTPNTAAKFAKFSSALRDQHAAGDERYIVSHISPQIEFPAGPPSLVSTIPDGPDAYHYDESIDTQRLGRALELQTTDLFSTNREFDECTTHEASPNSLERFNGIGDGELEVPTRQPQYTNVPKWEQLQYVSDSDDENKQASRRQPSRPHTLDINTPENANYNSFYDEYKTFDSNVVREVIRKATDANGIASPLANPDTQWTKLSDSHLDDLRNRVPHEEQALYDLSPEAMQDYGQHVDFNQFGTNESSFSPLSNVTHDDFIGLQRTLHEIRSDGGPALVYSDRDSVHSRKSVEDTVSFWTQGRASTRQTRSSESNSDEEFSGDDVSSTDITTSGTTDDEVSLATARDTSDEDQISLATLHREDNEDGDDSDATAITSSTEFEKDESDSQSLRNKDAKFEEEMAQLKKDIQSVLASTAELPEANLTRNSRSDDSFLTAPTSPVFSRFDETTPTLLSPNTVPKSHYSTPQHVPTEPDFEPQNSQHVVEHASESNDITAPDVHKTVYHEFATVPDVERLEKLTRSTELLTRPYTIDDFDTTLEDSKHVESQLYSGSRWSEEPKTIHTKEVSDGETTNQSSVNVDEHNHYSENNFNYGRSNVDTVSNSEITTDTSQQTSIDTTNIRETLTRKSSVSSDDEWRIIEESYVIETQPSWTSIPKIQASNDNQYKSRASIDQKTSEETPVYVTQNFSTHENDNSWNLNRQQHTVATVTRDESVTESGSIDAPRMSSVSKNYDDGDEVWRIVEEGEEINTVSYDERKFNDLIDQKVWQEPIQQVEVFEQPKQSDYYETKNVTVQPTDVSIDLNWDNAPRLSTLLENTHQTQPSESTGIPDFLSWKSETVTQHHHIHLNGSLETIAEEAETSSMTAPTEPPPLKRYPMPTYPPPQIIVSGTHETDSSDDDDMDQKSLSTFDDADDHARRTAIKLTRSDSESTVRSLESASASGSKRKPFKMAMATNNDDDSDETGSLRTVETRSRCSDDEFGSCDDEDSLKTNSDGSGRTTPTHASDDASLKSLSGDNEWHSDHHNSDNDW